MVTILTTCTVSLCYHVGEPYYGWTQMETSRRSLLQGIGLAGAFTLSGSRVWAAEVRVSSVQGVGVAPGVVRLLYNENPLGPSPLAVKAAAATLDASNRYPMQTVFELLAQVHSLHGLSFPLPASFGDVGSLFRLLDESSVLLGSGSTEVLRAVALAYGLEGGEIVEASPGYTEIGTAAESMLGNRIKRVKVPLADYRHDVGAMLKAVTPKTRIVVVTNPNNPTGTALTLSEITRLADGLDAKTLLVVDEAYIDFAATPGVGSAIGLATTRPNVLVTRTFSKIHGLAGLRLGYAISTKPVLQKVQPYLLNLLGVNSAVVAAGLASIGDVEHQRRSRQVALTARAQLMEKLPALGLSPVASDAPFVWVNVKKDCTPLVERLAKRGVLIAGGQRWQLPSYVRISTGQAPEMEAMFASLALKA